MNRELEQAPKFTIETPTTREDSIGIGEAQLQLWLETYPNDELGIDEEWIRSEVGFLVEDRGIDFREQQIEKARQPNSDVLYRVAKDETGKIVGFLHASRNEKEAQLDAIYLINEAQGTGVARRFMDEVFQFTGGLPIELHVAAYNDHAIQFYEKYGFVKGEVSQKLFHGRMPSMKMIRKEDDHEV